MPTQIEKLEAHASHLLDGFISLKEKYAILDPMLFDKEVINSRGQKVQARGFNILLNSLFLSCAQDIAKICFDSDKRTPSINNIVTHLAESALRGELKERYSVWRIPSAEKESDPEIIAAIKRMEQREQSERSEQFDLHYKQLVDSWSALSGSKVLNSFLTVRDRVSAHTEVRYIADKYQLIDIGSLGIKWGDLKKTIGEIQELVEVIGYIVRNAGFAWELLEEQLTEASSGFWRST